MLNIESGVPKAYRYGTFEISAPLSA
jgi:hypothetical protein